MKLFEVFKKASHEHVSELKALELLRERARNAHAAAKKTPIFASLKEEHPFILVDPVKSPRKTPYLLDGVIDELPSWRHYSKRLEAVIGYTSHEIAEKRQHDGKLYVVFPFDLSHVCVAPTVNFYSGFGHAATKLGIEKLDNAGLLEWLASLKKAAEELKVEVKQDEPSSSKQLLAQLRSLEGLKGRDAKALLDSEKLSDDDKRRLGGLLHRRGSVMDYLAELLDPDTNKFIRLHASHHYMPTDREVWTSGKCLLMAVDAYERLHERGDIK